MNDADDDDFCRFGTPLDPYEEDDVPKKKSAYQDITEQYALDSQGKRRFHGAFTGGFTAGHGNSVAVPEGWTPQTFKSSRADRMKLTQKAEDFMDDEDRNEFGIAPRQVHTTKEFSGAKRKNKQYFQDGPIPGEPVLRGLLEPVHETVAIKILKSMGWRPGRGIGEKITRGEKKTARKLYTCHVPTEFRSADEIKADSSEGQNKVDDSSEDDEVISEVLFEPDDFEPYLAKPKVDSFGIGYVGLSRHSILGAYVNPSECEDKRSKKSHLLTNEKGKKVSIRGQAFGVGALEDEDEDIYSREDMTGYDFSLDVSNKSKEKSEKKSKIAPTSSKSILEGFVAAICLQPPMKVYPPPALPHGYTPGRTRKSRFSNIDETQSEPTPVRDQGLGRHDLTARQRGSILGERPSEDPPMAKTTEALIKAKPSPKSNEEKLAAIVGRNINFVNDKAKEDDVTNPVKLPESDGPFKPFAANPSKQQRYENFIAVKQGLSSSYAENEMNSSDKLQNWERDRELYEFEQAYKLYKPLTGMMKDRFVSAIHQEDLTSPLVVTKDKDYFCHASSERQEAARLGMFGTMTRDTIVWRPESLLCKRFNVPEPLNGGYASQSVDKKKPAYSIFEYLENPVHDKSSYLKDQSRLKAVNSSKPTKPVEVKAPEPKKLTPLIDNDSTKKQKRLTVAELFMQEKEKEREILNVAANKESGQLAFQKELTRPDTSETAEVKETIDSFNKIDLYKAIFLSDSESEADDETSEASKETLSLADLAARNVERNPSPPRGIFANLNLDRINSWRKPDQDKDTDKEIVPESTKTVLPMSKTIAMEVEDVYGPKLPEKHLFTSKKANNGTKSDAVDVVISSSSDSSDDWVETTNDVNKKSKRSKSKSSKKKKKKEKSAKHHKHKTKKKHKRKN